MDGWMEEGSSATDSVTDVTDVTDVADVRKKEEGKRKKEESFLKLAMPKASFRPNYQFPMTTNQFPKQIGGALRPLLIN
jgi:hypothetical protein